MTFSETLKNAISNYHLLSHPFYEGWSRGEVPIQTIKEYAKEYYTHVTAFPRYISASHAQCDDLKKRRLLLENLADEEGLNGDTPHPELWLRFAEGLGLSRNEVKKNTPKESIKHVVKVFMQAARSSYAEGLASLYAYEYQVPEVAETKIKGLKEHYNTKDERSLSFFEVHREADVHHRKQCEQADRRFFRK